MTNKFKLQGLQLDPTKMRQFKEFLEFTLKKKSILKYPEFKQNCGISPAQWAEFRRSNIESQVRWGVE